MVFILVAEPWIPTLDMFKIVGKCQKLYSFTNRCIRGNFYWKAEQRAKVIMRLCMLYPTGFKWAHVACWYINFSLSLSLSCALMDVVTGCTGKLFLINIYKKTSQESSHLKKMTRFNSLKVCDLNAQLYMLVHW